MDEKKLQLGQQRKIRTVLRCVGLIFLCAGGLLMLIGIGSFFMAFGSSEPPRFFWCAFLGMPLLFIGSTMTMFGFLGAFQRFFVGETAPVAKDAVNYMGENTQPGVKAFAKAVTEGIKEGLSEEEGEKK